MSDYDKRVAQYERNKAAGTLYRNPFAGMSLPSGGDILDAILGPTPIGVAKGAYDAATAVSESPEVQDVLAQMKANNASHPIYGGVGENLGEDVLYDYRDAITGEVRNSDNVVNIPFLPEGTVSQDPEKSIAEGFTLVDETAMQPTDVTGEPVEAPLTPVQAAQDAHAAQNAVIDTQAKAAMVDAGASPEDVSAWDKFTDEFDVLTLGMHLMASNDGSGNLGANLGKALIAARGAKIQTRASEAAAAAAGRKEARAERETAVKEYNALTNRMGENRQAKTGTKPTAAHKAMATAYITDNPSYALANDEMTDEFATVMAANVAEAMQLQEGLPPEQRMSHADLMKFSADYALQQMQWTKQSTMFGLGKDKYGI